MQSIPKTSKKHSSSLTLQYLTPGWHDLQTEAVLQPSLSIWHCNPSGVLVTSGFTPWNVSVRVLRSQLTNRFQWRALWMSTFRHLQGSCIFAACRFTASQLLSLTCLPGSSCLSFFIGECSETSRLPWFRCAKTPYLRNIGAWPWYVSLRNVKSKSQFCLAGCGPRFGGPHAMKGKYLILSVDSKLKDLKYDFSFSNISHGF